MKFKLFFALLAIVLIAAGCGKSADPTQTQQENTQNANSAISETKDVSKQSSGTEVSDQSTTSYTLAQVQAANSESKCWTIVGDNVYDVTSFISKHPGGRDKVLALCGTDGTEPFTKQHGTFQKAIDTLASFKIGTLTK